MASELNQTDGAAILTGFLSVNWECRRCPNCKGHGPFEIRDNRFERIFFSTGYLPASCTKCGATWEMHYTLSSIRNLQLDEE